MTICCAVLLISCIAALDGCKGATKSGTPYTMLASRAIQAYLPGDLITVHTRAVAVVRDDFLFTITRDSHDALEGVIEALTARKDSVRIETFKHSDESTKIRVFVGPLGDEHVENEILSKIESTLPAVEK
jgi:hypothetical protein